MVWDLTYGIPDSVLHRSCDWAESEVKQHYLHGKSQDIFVQSSTGQSKLLWSGEMGSPQPLRDAVGQGSQDWDSPQD